MSGLAALAYIERGDGAVLSVWNRKYHCWGLPGGKVEEGETLGEALRRELFEETNLVVIGDVYRTLDISPTYSGSGRICHTFEVRVASFADIRLREVGTGIAWHTKDFLKTEPTTGPWFRAFFDRRGGK